MLRISEHQDYWSEAEPLIAQCLIGTSDTTEKVAKEISEKRAIFLASEKAFCVVKPTEEYFIVWAAASRGSKGCMKEYLPQLEEMARINCSKQLWFCTNQKWMAEMEGWTVAQYIMVRNV